VELASEVTTVRELIRAAVAEQIRCWRADRWQCRRMLDRQYLTEDEVRAQAATGVVRMPAVEAPAEPDVPVEVDRACRAFKRGVFAIFINGEQVHGLEERVTLRLGEPVVFVRLIALVGG
jgi:hypothetical protein